MSVYEECLTAGGMVSWGRNGDALLNYFSENAFVNCTLQEGGGGMLYWGDFLDLQAEGPLPWRKEIEEGIATCSKFVVFVDKAWLTSYNCLQVRVFLWVGMGPASLRLHANPRLSPHTIDSRARSIICAPHPSGAGDGLPVWEAHCGAGS